MTDKHQQKSKATGGTFNGLGFDVSARNKTYILSNEEWNKLEQHLAAIEDITKNAKEFDTSTLPKGAGLPALIWRDNNYVDQEDVEET